MRVLGGQPVLIDQVYDTLLTAISDGELEPGTRLAQEKLADQLGISRQPISHALTLLKQQGFVVEHGRRGLQVAPLDAEHLRNLYQVRAALDALAAGLAAARVADGTLSKDALARLEKTIEQGLAAVQAQALPALRDADVAFHDSINRLAGNPVLSEMIGQQWPHFRRAMSQVLRNASGYQAIWNEHMDIFAAILAGDRDRAKSLAGSHAARAGAATYKRLKTLTGVEETQP